MEEAGPGSSPSSADSGAIVDERKGGGFQEPAIGIDIGTYQSTVAMWNGTEIELLKNSSNENVIRSCVTFKEEKPSIIPPSRELEVLSGSAIFNMKRLIGRLDTDPLIQASSTVPFLVQTHGTGVRPLIAAVVKDSWRSITAEETLAIFLVELKALAELQFKRQIWNVVLTVPVSFTRFQLSRMERACAMAGLRVLRLMAEPSAVAMVYAQQQLRLHPDDGGGKGTERTALIFNMGAGFCDAAVATGAGGVSQIRSLSGIPIGGEDLLQNTMEFLVPDLEKRFANRSIDDIKSIGLLRASIQNVIEKLSTEIRTEVIVVDLWNGINVYRTMERGEFERVNDDIFEKVKMLVAETLVNARVAVGDIDDVILVGGCSAIPRVRNLVLELCKKDYAYTAMDPLEAAARGAAIEGAVTAGVAGPSGALNLLSIQATPVSVGICADGGKFVRIIPRNTTIPARMELRMTTAHDEQTAAMVVVCEGEGERVEENHLLGYFTVTGILPEKKGVPEIQVCVDIDAANVLRVLAQITLPGREKRTVPWMEVRMPTVDVGHGWEAVMSSIQASGLDLVTCKKKSS